LSVEFGGDLDMALFLPEQKAFR
jgi:hypothetical protein